MKNVGIFGLISMTVEFKMQNQDQQSFTIFQTLHYNFITQSYPIETLYLLYNRNDYTSLYPHTVPYIYRTQSALYANLPIYSQMRTDDEIIIKVVGDFSLKVMFLVVTVLLLFWNMYFHNSIVRTYHFYLFCKRVSDPFPDRSSFPSRAAPSTTSCALTKLKV